MTHPVTRRQPAPKGLHHRAVGPNSQASAKEERGAGEFLDQGEAGVKSPVVVTFWSRCHLCVVL